MLIQLPERVVLEVSTDSALAQLVFPAWLGDKRHVRILRQWIAEAVCDEDLAWCIRQVLRSPDDMRDLHVMVINHVGQVVQYCAVSPLDDMVLLLAPGDFDAAADVIVKDAATLLRHLQAHHALAALSLEAGAGCRCLGHPAAAVVVGILRLLCSLPHCPQLAR